MRVEVKNVWNSRRSQYFPGRESGLSDSLLPFVSPCNLRAHGLFNVQGANDTSDCGDRSGSDRWECVGEVFEELYISEQARILLCSI